MAPPSPTSPTSPTSPPPPPQQPHPPPAPPAARPALRRRRRVARVVTGLVVAGAVGLAALAALVAVGQAGGLRGQPAAPPGVVDGRLAPPSATDNSVSSQAGLWRGHPRRDAARIDPLPADGDAEATMARVRRAALALPGAALVSESPGYLHVAYESRWLGFVDDAEFWFDADAGVVQLRSASRLGRRDFGVNRARIEALRARLAAPG
jgi:uncharacterized protein (DUF1499 family)